MDQGQGVADGRTAESRRGTTSGRTEDDDEEDGVQYDFGDEHRTQTETAGREVAVAVGGEGAGGVGDLESRSATGDDVDDEAAKQTTDNLGGDVGRHLGRVEFAAGDEAQRDRGIEVATRDMAHGVALSPYWNIFIHSRLSSVLVEGWYSAPK